MTNHRHIVATPDEAKLLHALREQIDRGICQADVAGKLARVINSDLHSPVGEWLTTHGIFEVREVS